MPSALPEGHCMESFNERIGEMEVLEGIYTRRSIRDFTQQAVEGTHVLEIIKAGSRAPSGLNNQPWRFVVVRGKAMRGELAKLTRYSRILVEAPVAIAVFIDHTVMYHDVKDYQAIGACLQNMLLAAHSLDLGAVWLGEILKNASEIRVLFDLPDNLELMAVVALGHPAKTGQESGRREISELLLKEF
ncbi:MAG: nitroreductase [Geobacteraceae bacterium]|nr:nitroreductase [Geobacteraceae bacterium]